MWLTAAPFLSFTHTPSLIFNKKTMEKMIRRKECSLEFMWPGHLPNIFEAYWNHFGPARPLMAFSSQDSWTPQPSKIDFGFVDPHLKCGKLWPCQELHPCKLTPWARLSAVQAEAGDGGSSGPRPCKGGHSSLKPTLRQQMWAQVISQGMGRPWTHHWGLLLSSSSWALGTVSRVLQMEPLLS